MFDGVHLGHQQVLRQTLEDARELDGMAVAITFDRHPNAVVAPTRTPPLICSLEVKLRCIEALGFPATLLLKFDRALSERPAEEFIRSLISGFSGLHSLCVGSAFTFGHRRQGNVALLKRLGTELGFHVHGLAAVSLDGQMISSTRIRDSIRGGDLDAAGQMLGRPYRLVAKVVPGKQLGNQLGFPTANLEITGLVTPPSGVYAVRAEWPGGSGRGVANLGRRPTIDAGSDVEHAEVHLLDLSPNLYGKELSVQFVSRLRDEKKFPSIEALKEQIVRDVAAARASFQAGSHV
jgi:riboflavin kinase/FMN adenylyltransferase